MRLVGACSLMVTLAVLALFAVGEEREAFATSWNGVSVVLLKNVFAFYPNGDNSTRVAPKKGLYYSHGTVSAESAQQVIDSSESRATRITMAAVFRPGQTVKITKVRFEKDQRIVFELAGTTKRPVPPSNVLRDEPWTIPVAVIWPKRFSPEFAERADVERLLAEVFERSK
jgi:hypothetical protein